MSIKGNKSKGFTLAEIMIAVFISSLVLTAVYGVWRKVSGEIAFSAARQKLQKELRSAMNFIQKDFRSIKSGTFESDNDSENADSINIKFEKFTEAKEGKLAQESTEPVSYSLSNNIFSRETQTGKRILSSHVKSVSINNASEGGAGSFESENSDFRAAKEAQLNISITGAIRIPGKTIDYVFTEKTSIVMRNEYQKSLSKNHKSNFDLAKNKLEEMVKEDTSQDAFFAPGGDLDIDSLKNLDNAQLKGMKKNQEDMIKQAKESLDEMKDNIKGTDTGESWFSKFGDFLNFMSDSEGEVIRGLRKDLANSDTPEKADEVIKELEKYTKDKDADFLKKSTGKDISSLSQEEADLYKEAYEMKIQDRNMAGAYKLMQEQSEKEGNGDASETQEAPPSIKEQITQNINNPKAGMELSGEERDRFTKLLKCYDEISLDWMGEYGDEPKDVGIYNAAKSLISQGTAKKSMLEMRDISKENLDKINKCM